MDVTSDPAPPVNLLSSHNENENETAGEATVEATLLLPSLRDRRACMSLLPRAFAPSRHPQHRQRVTFPSVSFPFPCSFFRARRRSSERKTGFGFRQATPIAFCKLSAATDADSFFHTSLLVSSRHSDRSVVLEVSSGLAVITVFVLHEALGFPVAWFEALILRELIQ
eukprot:GHVU01192044.1.p1 GENE.GHVU01192044.1~~GHVU01192044.1.p1  ORF type:complete len:168 (+),score=1.87 GHVU01192044.1:55-558(+)